MNGFRKMAAFLGAAFAFTAFVLAIIAFLDAINRCPGSQCRDAALSVALYITAGIFCILITRYLATPRKRKCAQGQITKGARCGTRDSKHGQGVFHPLPTTAHKRCALEIQSLSQKREQRIKPSVTPKRLANSHQPWQCYQGCRSTKCRAQPY